LKSFASKTNPNNLATVRANDYLTYAHYIKYIRRIISSLVKQVKLG